MTERAGGPVKLFQKLTCKTILVVGCTLALMACDDSAPSGPTGSGGSGGSGATAGSGGSGAEGGSGGEGGSAQIPCAQDSQCPDGTYCGAIGDNGIGSCLPGCTDDDSCMGDQICNLETRDCEDPPCESDADCPDPTTYCNDGDCVEGCRGPGEACDEPVDGRASVCDEETRVCVGLFPCCTGVNECAAMLPSACEAMAGVVLNGAVSCDTNPCGVPCDDDDDCGDDLNRFCNTEDMRCGDGCRLDVPGSCGRGQICDEATHQCIDLNCGNNNDCDDPARFCDTGVGLCVPGCRSDDNCPDGQSCIDNECVQFCDPADEDACEMGFYCDPDNNRCVELCTEHADCPEGRFCEAESGICRAGCRDDEGALGEPNDDQETATAIELSAPDAQGRQFGSIDNRVLCDDNADVFRVDVPAGARIRVDVQFDQGTPTFNLDGNSGNCGENQDCADSLQWICEDRTCVGPTQEAEGRDQHAFIEYPGLDELVADEASYFITVNPTNQRVNFRVDVAVVDARTGCFPDRFEQEGNNNRNAAVELERGFAETITGTLCDGDEDWFYLDVDANDGLSLNLRSLTGEEINVFLFDQDSDRGAPALQAGQMSDRVDHRQNTSFFVPPGRWNILVAGLRPDTTAEYQLDVLHTPSVFECPEGDQGETMEDAAQLMVGVGEEVDVGQALMNELVLCNEGEPDVDLFCLEVGDGEVLSAALVMTDQNAMAGRARVQIRNDEMVVQGRQAFNTVGDAREWSTVRGTLEGTYCIRVDGVGRTQGAYNLHIRRSENMAGMCGLDEDEVDGLRNDRASEATELEDVSMDGTRFSHESGYLCDIDRSDEDWYSFTIAEAQSALCVTVTDFDADVVNADIGIYPAVGQADGPDCTARGQAECDDGGGGACIPGPGNRRFCTAPLDRSARSFDYEMINLRRNIFRDRAGDYLIRVYHRDENEGRYQLDVSVTPPREGFGEMCGRDQYEPNDSANDARPLGSGQVAICDAYFCELENNRNEEDWFEIEVPAGQDRTVLVNYSNLTEGRVEMQAIGPNQPGDDGAAIPSGTVTSNVRAGNFQCVNIQGGAADATISLGLEPLFAPIQDGPRRLDYSIQVVPTDLDADPNGACVFLGANDLGACGPQTGGAACNRDRDCGNRGYECIQGQCAWEELPNFGRLQPENCWPTIYVP